MAGQAGGRSPYELALAGLPAGLHPRLRTYFSAIPTGWHGHGEGVFAAAGCRRRWLRPLFAIVVPADVMFPVWERNVPFTVVNRPVMDAQGRVGVAASRRFRFRSGERTMNDLIATTPDRLADVLGAGRRFTATLTPSVVDGALRLESTGVAVRVGRRRMPLPRVIAPRVPLTERFDDATGRQQVALVIDLPGIGIVYEYAGSFSYEIRPGEGTS